MLSCSPTSKVKWSVPSTAAEGEIVLALAIRGHCGLSEARAVHGDGPKATTLQGLDKRPIDRPAGHAAVEHEHGRRLPWPVVARRDSPTVAGSDRQGAVRRFGESVGAVAQRCSDRQQTELDHRPSERRRRRDVERGIDDCQLLLDQRLGYSEGNRHLRARVAIGDHAGDPHLSFGHPIGDGEELVALLGVLPGPTKPHAHHGDQPLQVVGPDDASCLLEVLSRGVV